MRLFLALILIFGFGSLQVKEEMEVNARLSMAGNSWIFRGSSYVKSDILTSEGIRNWTNSNEIIRTFVYVDTVGEVSLGIKGRIVSGKSALRISLDDQSKEIQLTNSEQDEIEIGTFSIKKPGYHVIEFTGLSKEGDTFAEIDEVLIGRIKDSNLRFIRDEFYWGRRGPSVHLRFNVSPNVENIEWFYSEILIPEGEDVIGSYFMANGFAQGYFGIQVNSASERRILFSVWSPFKTDDPSSVPPEDKILLLKKGKGVTTGEFGNEGTGGQSYKVFDWKAGLNYGFLLGAKPNEDNTTDFVAYFFDPEEKKWNLIAEFRRPKTSTYLTRLYSFLENFIPHQGVFARKGYYTNQWVRNKSGWHELTEIEFTADNTGRKQNRVDYSGGVEDGMFFLRNCGFFSERTQINSLFRRKASDAPPEIDFSLLP